MSKTLKIVVGAAVIIIAIGFGLWGAWYWFTHQAIPETKGELQIPGLEQPVDILRDEYGVAHIYAQTSHDLFFAQGYVHAQERFWQMEFQRRVASGRLSEIFGQGTLDTDIYLRQFGFHDLAQQTYELLDDENRQILDAYAEGVNAYIADRRPAKLGLEFAILGLKGVAFEIEPWSPVDSLAWGEMLIFDQSDQLHTELNNIELLAIVGEKKFNQLHPPYREDRPVIIPEDDPSLIRTSILESNGLGKAEVAYLEMLGNNIEDVDIVPPLLQSLRFPEGGSNSFVVSGSYTNTGEPILANDPHMSVNLPSLWYEVGMQCVEKSPDCIYNFHGFSLPGVPGILIGYNDRIAWGLTNATFDAEDVFIEKINPENPNQYEVNGEWVDMDIRQEVIKVAGQDDPVVITVRHTRNGLVATDAMIDHKPFSYGDDGPELYVLSYAWTALEPVQTLRAVMMVNRAQNWDDFVEALSYFDAGKQNWLYADVDGNIGYVLPGKIPIRAGGDGSLPVPGWNDDYVWTGFIPYDELPRTFNPRQGYIVTANNPQLRDEEPYLLNKEHDRGQRAQRIVNMIFNADDKINVDMMKQFQTDNKSLSALEIIPYLREIQFNDEKVSAARDRLLGWDAQMRMESSEAALFNIFWTHLLADTFDDQLPEEHYLTGNHRSSDVVYFLLQNPRDDWWDDKNTPDVIEDRDAILEKAFDEAYSEGVEKLGDNLDKWQWGELHKITYQNATLGKSGIGFIENIFNRGPFPVNGSESVVQKTCWRANKSFDVICIPSLRQVVDLSNLSNSVTIHSVGQSGHPYSSHYDDFIELWRNLEYHPVNWTREEVESGEYELLTLQPTK